MYRASFIVNKQPFNKQCLLGPVPYLQLAGAPSVAQVYIIINS